MAINAVDKETGEEYPELDTQAMPIANEYTGTYSYPQRMAYKPTFAQNLAYFFNYQLNHVYLRYFMWNFAGRRTTSTTSSASWTQATGFTAYL